MHPGAYLPKPGAQDGSDQCVDKALRTSGERLSNMLARDIDHFYLKITLFPLTSHPLHSHLCSLLSHSFPFCCSLSNEGSPSDTGSLREKLEKTTIFRPTPLFTQASHKSVLAGPRRVPVKVAVKGGENKENVKVASVAGRLTSVPLSISGSTASAAFTASNPVIVSSAITNCAPTSGNAVAIHANGGNKVVNTTFSKPSLPNLSATSTASFLGVRRLSNMAPTSLLADRSVPHLTFMRSSQIAAAQAAASTASSSGSVTSSTIGTKGALTIPPAPTYGSAFGVLANPTPSISLGTVSASAAVSAPVPASYLLTAKPTFLSSAVYRAPPLTQSSATIAHPTRSIDRDAITLGPAPASAVSSTYLATSSGNSLPAIPSHVISLAAHQAGPGALMGDMTAQSAPIKIDPLSPQQRPCNPSNSMELEQARETMDEGKPLPASSNNTTMTSTSADTTITKISQHPLAFVNSPLGSSTMMSSELSRSNLLASFSSAEQREGSDYKPCLPLTTSLQFNESEGNSVLDTVGNVEKGAQSKECRSASDGWVIHPQSYCTSETETLDVASPARSCKPSPSKPTLLESTAASFAPSSMPVTIANTSVNCESSPTGRTNDHSEMHGASPGLTCTPVTPASQTAAPDPTFPTLFNATPFSKLVMETEALLAVDIATRAELNFPCLKTSMADAPSCGFSYHEGSGPIFDTSSSVSSVNQESLPMSSLRLSHTIAQASEKTDIAVTSQNADESIMSLNTHQAVEQGNRNTIFSPETINTPESTLDSSESWLPDATWQRRRKGFLVIDSDDSDLLEEIPGKDSPQRNVINSAEKEENALHTALNVNTQWSFPSQSGSNANVKEKREVDESLSFEKMDKTQEMHRQGDNEFLTCDPLLESKSGPKAEEASIDMELSMGLAASLAISIPEFGGCSEMSNRTSLKEGMQCSQIVPTGAIEAMVLELQEEEFNSKKEEEKEERVQEKLEQEMEEEETFLKGDAWRNGNKSVGLRTYGTRAKGRDAGLSTTALEHVSSLSNTQAHLDALDIRVKKEPIDCSCYEEECVTVADDADEDFDKKETLCQNNICLDAADGEDTQSAGTSELDISILSIHDFRGENEEDANHSIKSTSTVTQHGGSVRTVSHITAEKPHEGKLQPACPPLSEDADKANSKITRKEKRKGGAKEEKKKEEMGSDVQELVTAVTAVAIDARKKSALKKQPLIAPESTLVLATHPSNDQAIRVDVLQVEVEEKEEEQVEDTYCRVCKQRFASVRNLQKHFESRKHIAALDLLEEQERDENDEHSSDEHENDSKLGQIEDIGAISEEEERNAFEAPQTESQVKQGKNIYIYIYIERERE